jgi:hypothetical protein
MYWIHIPCSRIQWSAHMNTVRKKKFSIKGEDKFTNCLLLEKDLAPWDQIIKHQFYTPPNSFLQFARFHALILSLNVEPLLRFQPFIRDFIRRVRKIEKSDSSSQPACLSVCLSTCMSVRMSAWNNSAPNGRTFTQFDTWIFFENLLRNLKIH